MIKNLQFYISTSLNPYENLATEKQLFDLADDDTVILYLWQNENTIVIGRNQNPWVECRVDLAKSNNVLIARRLSGGGAVFHDVGNLNFTFIAKNTNYDLQKQMLVLKKACALAGIEAELSGRNDILTQGKKFSGNAFYSSGGTSYHHGTILLSADKEKMTEYLTPPKAKLESKGIKSVRSRVINLCELNNTLTIEKMRQYMLYAFSRIYSLPATEISFLNKEENRILAQEYGSWNYLFSSPIPCSISLENSFEWGHISLGLEVKDGHIIKVQAFTDSMDITLPKKLDSALNNVRFNHQELRLALDSVFPQNISRDIFALIATVLN